MSSAVAATEASSSSSNLEDTFLSVLREEGGIDSISKEVVCGKLDRFTRLLQGFVNNKHDTTDPGFSDRCFACAEILVTYLQDTTNSTIDPNLVEKVVEQFIKLEVFLTADKQSDGIMRCRGDRGVTFNSVSLYLTSDFFRKNSTQSEIDFKAYSTTVVQLFLRCLYGADIQKDRNSSLPVLIELHNLAVTHNETRVIEKCEEILLSKVKKIKIDDQAQYESLLQYPTSEKIRNACTLVEAGLELTGDQVGQIKTAFPKCIVKVILGSGKKRSHSEQGILDTKRTKLEDTEKKN
jgi:hypothetical protein